MKTADHIEPHPPDQPQEAGPADAEVRPVRGRRTVLWTVLTVAVVLGGFLLLLVTARAPLGRSAVVGRPAPSPERSFTTVKGDQARLVDFRGRYVVLNFFASWCVPV